MVMAPGLPLGHAINPFSSAKSLWRSHFWSLLVQIGIVNKMMDVMLFESMCLWPFPAALSCVRLPLLFVVNVVSVFQIV